MKSLKVYIFERVKDLPDSVKGLIVFDIDDTILKVDPALSSSIFLTTATDVLGFFLFLSLASIFLSKLL